MKSMRVDESELGASRHSMVVPVEKRREPRYLLRFAITIRGDNNFYLDLSDDISAGGIFIATQKLLPVGTPVILSFTLAGYETSLSAEGVVRWQRGPDATAHEENIFGHDHTEVKFGMGVEFRDLDDETALAIRSFMRRRRPEFFD